MPSNKLIVAFAPFGEAAFQVRVSTILDALTNHPQIPEPWPAPVPSLAQLRAEDTAYREAHLAVQRRDMAQIHKRDEARERLSRSLQRVAAYVELLADGNVGMLQTCGFEMRPEPGRTNNTGGGGAAYIGLLQPVGRQPSPARWGFQAISHRWPSGSANQPAWPP